MRVYYDFFLLNHTHTEATDCVGNPRVISSVEVDEFFSHPEVTNVTFVDDLLLVSGNVGDKHFVAERLFEREDALKIEERFAWSAPFDRYVCTVEPDWDKIPTAVKENGLLMADYESIQGSETDALNVEGMLRCAAVKDVRITDEGAVSGYDCESATRYTYTPVK